MVTNKIISPTKANRLYWLGRYEERVYLTLHLLRKCYDKMIDGDSADYDTFWQKLDITNSYQTEEAFISGMMYDAQNPSSIISAQLRAQDNAILLREDIMSETLSYIEMAVALMRRLSSEPTLNILALQPVTDWALAFWGSVQQRVFNRKARMLMYLGREVENMDFLLRFNYPMERILFSYDLIRKHLLDFPEFCDRNILSNIDDILMGEKFAAESGDVRLVLMKYFTQLVTV